MKGSSIFFLFLFIRLYEWAVWFGVKFTPGGHSTFFGLLNTFVHIIMYTYYLLTAMGPQYQKYLWWKKYLTALQMVIISVFGWFIENFVGFIDLFNIGSIHSHHGSRISTPLYRMQLSKSLCLVDWHACCYVLLFI